MFKIKDIYIYVLCVCAFRIFTTYIIVENTRFLHRDSVTVSRAILVTLKISALQSLIFKRSDNTSFCSRENRYESICTNRKKKNNKYNKQIEKLNWKWTIVYLSDRKTIKLVSGRGCGGGPSERDIYPWNTSASVISFSAFSPASRET